MPVIKGHNPEQPEYINKIFPVYNDIKKSNFRDKNFVVNALSLGYRKKLIFSVLREIEQSQSVLQIGATFGKQIEDVASKVGYYGIYHLVDINKTQLERCKKKYKNINQNMNFSNQSGLVKITDKYDKTISFFLLSELPHITRKKMVNNLLDSVKEGGKVIFVEYHRPKNFFFRKFFLFFSRLYNPFIEELWDQDILKLADNSSDFMWHKSLMFGGLYQKTIATRKKVNSSTTL